MDDQNEINSDNTEIPSVLDSMAIELHEMFLALKRAGFEHKDAVSIISHAVAMGAMDPVHFSHVDNSGEDSDDYGDGTFL